MTWGRNPTNVALVFFCVFSLRTYVGEVTCYKLFLWVCVCLSACIYLLTSLCPSSSHVVLGSVSVWRDVARVGSLSVGSDRELFCSVWLGSMLWLCLFCSCFFNNSFSVLVQLLLQLHHTTTATLKIQYSRTMRPSWIRTMRPGWIPPAAPSFPRIFSGNIPWTLWSPQCLAWVIPQYCTVQ